MGLVDKEKQRAYMNEYQRNRYAVDPAYRLMQSHAVTREKRPIGYLLTKARVRAVKKGLEFSITKEDIQIPEFCPVFPWIKLEWSDRLPPDSSPSLDRINPAKGYIKGNVRVISMRANRLKSDSTLQELEHLIEDAKWNTRSLP